ncbi:MAG: Gfo/Idh/MocA family oxidoreductase [Chitinophagaceae bacterium]|nr:MAG: Gfo/Idh/MocA family oxidoreductase [Chitinophagaceae bacterium]
MAKINWGIIGCGDVTEIKSGPAFNKVKGSALVAVMRRDEAKARDYARRHNVPRWYTDASELIHDPAVNAIYVATPPSSHLLYTLAAIRAGKPVYVEKPMTVNAAEAKKMAAAASASGVKLSIAHYRRAQPLFLKIQALLLQKAIGEPRYISLELNKKRLDSKALKATGNAWRVDPAIAGGGLFNDLAPHQLDILYMLFGNALKVQGLAVNQAKAYKAADMVSAQILFEGNVMFTGNWCFSAAVTQDRDTCTITGDTGSISFSFFGQAPVILEQKGKFRVFEFPPLQHVQQPMIGEVVKYFSGGKNNPCPASEGLTIMQWIDKINKG